MRRLLGFAAVIVLAVGSWPAEETGFRDPLLDRLAGSWVMEGTISGDPVVHDLEAEWVLEHHYLRFHERARERTEAGRPAYEAIVFIGWDEASSRYVCLWLDSTGGGGLVPEGFGYGRREGDSIPFVFGSGDESRIHNTFFYDRDLDRWRWEIDIKKPEGNREFARVVLNRKKS